LTHPIHSSKFIIRLSKTARLSTVALVWGVLLSACQGQANQTPTADEQVAEEALTTVVSATGVLTPVRFANLSLNTAGVVGEVLVSEGEYVQTGQPLVRLAGGDPQNPSPEIQAALRLRELEVDAAQQALDSLGEQADAQALQAEQTLNTTANQIRDLQYRLAELDLPDSQVDLSPLDAYDAALEVYQAAEAAFAPYRDEDNDSERRERKEELDEAKEDYDIAVTRLQLSLALGTAEASRDQARQDWEKYRTGPPGDELLQAVKRLNSAKAGLEAARSALDSLTLTAPFSGTVSQILVKVGEWAVPGVPALTLADLSSLDIETTDLNEIDLVRVAVGDPVKVSFDALPETILDGQVTAIASQASPGAGVNYTVTITIGAVPDSLRWGMSAFVDILPQK
jgi:multidrug resistance efflux pump